MYCEIAADTVKCSIMVSIVHTQKYHFNVHLSVTWVSQLATLDFLILYFLTVNSLWSGLHLHYSYPPHILPLILPFTPLQCTHYDCGLLHLRLH